MTLRKRRAQQAKRRETAEQRAARVMREAKVRRVQVGLGLAVVGGAVLGAVLLALMHRIPWPVAVGLTLLALFRGYALRREMQRQSEPETPHGLRKEPDQRNGLIAIDK